MISSTLSLPRIPPLPSMAFSSSSHFVHSPHLPKPRTSLSIIRFSSSDSSPFDLQTYWSNLLGQINNHLDSSIPIRYPESIFKSIRHSVLSPGAKRAAPVLCLSVASGLFGLSLPSSLPTAAALEMVHAASLIHDDLPSFDASPFRRGHPSNHSLFGDDLAVLAGDSLLPLAIHHLTSLTPSSVEPSVLIAVVREIARAVGSTGMAAGQFLDLNFQDCNGDSGRAMEIVEKKFGEMGECAAACGGYLGGATDEEMGRLRRYGRAVGMLYQLVDDLLMADREVGGMRRNVSVVKEVGLERATEMVEEIRGAAKREVEELESKYGERKVLPLYSFVDYAVERGFIVEAAAAV